MRKNSHVRICGGLGSATTLVYPTPHRRERTDDLQLAARVRLRCAGGVLDS